MPVLPLSYRKLPPGGCQNVNDANLRPQSVDPGDPGGAFVEGSFGAVEAVIVVFDETVVLEEFINGMKFRGCSWWNITGSGYGRGTGGKLNLRAVLCTSGLTPRFTDPTAKLCEELNITPQTRYNAILAAIGGFPGGSDGPDWWPFYPRLSGAMATMPVDTPVAFCFWNSDPNPGQNYGSLQDARMREYPFPSNYPGASSLATISGRVAPGGNIGTTPAGGTGYRDSSTGRCRPANSFVCTDKNSPLAVMGLDPREHRRTSDDGGATWPDKRVGIGAGSYSGDPDPSQDGSRYPWYGYKPSGAARIYVQPDYQPTSAGKTRTYTLLEDCTITAVGGFVGGASLGTVTVVHKRGGTTITTRTASGGSFTVADGYGKNDLSGTIIGLAGDTVDITSTGTPQASDSDANTVLFGVSADRPALWPLKADGRSIMYGTASAPVNPPPATPAGLAVTAFTYAHCALAWTAVVDADLVGYNLWRRVSGVGSYVKLNSSPIVGTTYDDTTVAAGVTYQYEVSAIDALPQESALSAPVSQAIPAAPDTTRPASPAMPTLTIGDSQITVDQIPLNSEPDMDHYTLEYKQSSSGTWIGLGTVTWPHLVLALTNGVAYDFRTYAVDFSGNVSLAPSAVATGTPVAAPVVPPPVITPDAPQLPPLADSPHFGFPFYVASHSPPRVNVVEQDSPEHVMSCLDVIARCPIGFRIERPDFGIPWLEYRSTLDPAESLENALLEFEPRAQMHIDVVREWAAEAQARMTANVEVDGG